MIILKVLGILVGLLLILALIFFLLQRRLDFCRRSYDTMISEFAISKPTTNLFDRAQELGFVAYAFKDPDSSSFDHNEFWMEKNESKNIALQKRLDEMKHGYLEIQIRPWPPFLRWIIDFQVESGIVKSVSRSQLD